MINKFILGCIVLGGLSYQTYAQKPNIIVIYTDDHGYADINAQGVLTDLKTPNIDELALNGARMTDGYSTAPQCVPSRGGLLSGQYQNKFGLESNGDYKTGGLNGFNSSLTIAERLKPAGYATGMAGKWHLGEGSEITDHGFDWVFYKNSNRPGLSNFRMDGTEKDLGPENTNAYHLDACSDAAVTFINKFKEQPFFFYLAYRAPHVPLDAPQHYLDRFPGEMPERRRQALAMLSAVDDGVGKIMQTLRDLKIEENTLIFIIGDNGAPLKIHKLDAPGGGPGWDGSLNTPMNGEKGMLTEGGIRVPFVAYWKGRITGGQVYAQPVITLDVAATAVAIAGLPKAEELDGVNLIPFLNGQSHGAPHETLFWRWVGQSAIRTGKWKYLRGESREYLFDLEADVEESRNLLSQYPTRAQELRKQLDQWDASLMEPANGDEMSSNGQKYFDWYLDGKREAQE